MLYYGVSSSVKFEHPESKEIRVTKKLKQSCYIALTPFKFYLEGDVEKWKKKCSPVGIAVGEYRLYGLHFADDYLEEVWKSGRENVG